MSTKRNFETDFCLPAIEGLTRTQALRVGKALDAAVCFAILEFNDGNPSLKDIPAVETRYRQLIGELKE
jgi:hypothetical protein